MIGPRTSRDASRTTLAGDLPVLAARSWRMRRTMFSMSMMASSTTTPTAMTRPARIITLIELPER